MNLKHLWWIVPCAFVAGSFFVAFFSAYYYNHTAYPTLKIHQEMYGHWACMDGCSNMQEIVEGKPTFHNMTAKVKHDACTEVCCHQYMETLGCSE